MKSHKKLSYDCPVAIEMTNFVTDLADPREIAAHSLLSTLYEE